MRGIRHNVFAGIVGVTVFVAGADVAMSQCKTFTCPITGKTFTSGQSGGSSCAVATKAEINVTVVRTVDQDGRVDYLTVKDTDLADKKEASLGKKYEEALAWRQKVDEKLSAQNLKNERMEPVHPIVEVVGKDIKKAQASALVKNAKDYAVYEIDVNGAVERQISYAHSDDFVKAIAGAKYAKMHNVWAKAGSPETKKPTEPVVRKVTDAMSKSEAQKALREKPVTVAKLNNEVGG